MVGKQIRASWTDRLLIVFIGGMFFIPYLGGVHLFDWDEINFAECAREMLVSGKFLQVQIGFQPFWEKPPLFFWVQALSMRIFGVHEFAARLPNALIGIATLLVLYGVGLRIRDRLFARLWVLAWLGSLLPHFYFRSGIIDPWFNFWIFLSLWYFFRAVHFEDKKVTRAVWGGVFLGLAVLTKGPVAGLIAVLTFLGYVVYWRRWQWLFGHWRKLVFFAVMALLVSVSWFLVDIALNGFWLTREFIKYQYRLFSTPDAGHAGFPAYHFVVLLVGCFPASIFAIRAFAKWSPTWATGFILRDFRRWMLALFWVVLILFSIVESKIVHYSSLAYYPLTFLAAQVLYDYLYRGIPLRRVQAWGLLVVGLSIVCAAWALPWLGRNMDWFLEYFPPEDPFAAQAMRVSVSWGILDYMPALLLFFSVVIGVLLALRNRWKLALFLLFGGMALFVQLALYRFVGKIEAYSQRSAIEFCESRRGEQMYIAPLYYKSYAHWFYAGVAGDWPAEAYDPLWLLRGDTDRPVYFLVKAQHADELQRKYPELELLYRKGGFVFFRRDSAIPHYEPDENL